MYGGAARGRRPCAHFVDLDHAVHGPRHLFRKALGRCSEGARKVNAPAGSSASSFQRQPRLPGNDGCPLGRILVIEKPFGPREKFHQRGKAFHEPSIPGGTDFFPEGHPKSGPREKVARQGCDHEQDHELHPLHGRNRSSLELPFESKRFQDSPQASLLDREKGFTVQASREVGPRGEFEMRAF